MSASNPLSNLSWKPSDLEASLRTLHEYVESQAQVQIDWYYHKKTWKARMSATLRVFAIMFFVLGGLVPLTKATFPQADFGQAGYLLIGLGGGCLVLDKFFGYSSGWIRYITTAMAIEKSLEEFRMQWTRQMARAAGTSLNTEQVDQLVQTCEAFSLAIKTQVEQETQAWVNEFQSNLAQLEKDLQTRADEVKKSKGAAAG